ncbi:MAG TPA: sigma-70 family RNA polymerase sigma factor [Thermoanaerobaculia bacterium]|nr:sigma-70 family RNA polymerase sigma factor [Thermoanaerobaculia bacterium]
MTPAVPEAPPAPGQSPSERFVTLLEAHRGILRRIAAAYCRDPEDRKDLVQEMTAQLWRSFPRFDEGQRFSTWMYRVGLNVAISSVRRAAVRSRHAAPGDPEVLVAAAAATDAAPGDRDLLLLERFLSRLDAFDRALLLLYLDGHAHAAIAEVLGISESNVGTRLGRLKQRLRRELDDNA